MSEKDLCWKCRKEVDDNFPRGAYPWVHCHHSDIRVFKEEPKLKPCKTCKKLPSYGIISNSGQKFYRIDCNTCRVGSVSLRDMDDVIRIWNRDFGEEPCWCKSQEKFEEWWKSLYPQHRYQVHFCPSCGEALGGRFIKL